MREGDFDVVGGAAGGEGGGAGGALVAGGERPEDAYLSAVRKCMHLYRAPLGFSGIYSVEEFNVALERSATDLVTGEFFTSRFARVDGTDPGLVMTLLVLRQRMIDEFAIDTVAEMLLVDQALIDVYHTLRMHTLLCDLEATVAQDVYVRGTARGMRAFEQDSLADILRNIADKVTPALVRMQDVLRRNLAELRRPGRQRREAVGLAP
jgi:hypothetical protein